jgi:Ca2+-transporting ATPase
MDINTIDGLSVTEVRRKHKKFGYNELPVNGKRKVFKIIIGTITEPMIFLLMSIILIYFFIGDKNEAILLLFSIVGIVSVELYQEMKAEKSLEALRNLSSPICDVIRGGQKVTIPGRELVVGDIVLLSEGSRVPSDVKMLSVNNLQVDESLLTGESLAVEKQDMNVGYSGTLVVKGHGIAEVIGIGLNTEIGKIGSSLKSINIEKTLLQKEINGIVKAIFIIAVGLSIILAISYWILRGDIIHGLLAGLTLAMAILPEEFPIVLALFLTMGAWRLAKNNVLARRAHTIETLGSATVLCVDKTGTLTENKMEILNIVNDKGDMYIGDFSQSAEILRYGILASQINPFDPMEEAFIEAGKSIFKDFDEDIYKKRNILKEYPVESNSLSVVQVWGINKPEIVALKGAPETVLRLCHLATGEQNKLESKVKELAGHGLRVIAVAKGRNISAIYDDRSEYEFEFLGLTGLADPIRKEVAPAIKLCKEAGIRVVMITGDYPETATHIAKQIGLDYQNIITGSEFEALSEQKKLDAIKNISVFSRVVPLDKLMIVDAFKKSGEIVAMTGDGVNDAPALKSAHIGIAMGKNGTDVARESASIVLLDDDFTSIVQGIRLGRRIYANLRKAMSYLFSVHIPIAVLSLVPIFFGWPLVLIPIHIVFLELIIDPSCTIIFESEREADNIMRSPPRKLSDPVFSKKMIIRSIVQGSLIALMLVVVYKLLLNAGWSADKSRGMTFLMLILSNILLIFSISGKRVVENIFNKESRAMLVIISMTIILLIVVFCNSGLRTLFKFAPLSIQEVLIGIILSILSAIAIALFLKISKKIGSSL